MTLFNLNKNLIYTLLLAFMAATTANAKTAYMISSEKIFITKSFNAISRVCRPDLAGPQQ
jgi:hypothetical protein